MESANSERAREVVDAAVSFGFTHHCDDVTGVELTRVDERLNAAQVAAKGFIAEDKIFETKLGFFEVFGKNSEAAAVMRDAGKTWSILTDMGIKLVPGGHPHHAVAEAAANAAHEGDVKPEEVAAIAIARPGLQVFTGPQFPTDLIGVAHSPAYFAAAGVADRNFTWAHAFPEKINDPRIRGLLGKVTTLITPGTFKALLAS